MARDIASRGQGVADFFASTNKVQSIGSVGQVRQSVVKIRNRVPLGPGSSHTGSWQDVRGFYTKTFMLLSQGSSTPTGQSAGSFSIVTGMSGTGVNDLTGTYYGPVKIVAGSLTSFSTSEAMGFIRPVFDRNDSHRGTVSVFLGLQA